MKLLNWHSVFSGIYSLDSYTPPLQNKAALLKILKTNLNIKPQGTLYIGDRLEDKTAAAEAGISFAMAAWGYNNHQPTEASCVTIQKPGDLVKVLENNFL